MKSSFILLVFIAAINCGYSNNLAISNGAIVITDTSSKYCMVQFDIDWENSWRDSVNWDAAWIFIKFRYQNSTEAWSHATFNYVDGSSDGHGVPINCSASTPSDGKGVFLYRNSNGSGDLDLNNVQLRWNYGDDSISVDSIVEFRIFGIEMVLVPQDSFYLGDGEFTNGHTYANFEATTSGGAFYVTSENAITLGGGGQGSLGNNNRLNQYGYTGCSTCYDCSSSGCLSGSGDDFDDSNSQTLPQAFPKGYEAFYCMKYELSQRQFADMLNTLTSTQQNLLDSRTNFYLQSGGVLSDYRYGVVGNSGVFSSSFPYLPQVFLDWQRGASYADWCGLRPMTELEFEKACRGPETSVLREFAWGNANMYLTGNLTVSNSGDADESIATGYDSLGVNGNAWTNDGTNHTMAYVGRIGIFAAHSGNTGRVSSGASYYGIMELSGNAWERAVSVGHTEGRKFTGLHGDGILSIGGYANVNNWPGTFSGSEVNSNVGVGYRGGALAYPSPNIPHNGRVSSRRLASGYWDAVIHDDGIRLVRTVD